MCDLNGKRSALNFPSSCCKRVKPNVEHSSYKTSSAGETSSPTSSTSFVGHQNERFQPVAFLGNTDYHPPTTPQEYISGLPLQPEELLLYCLIKISSPGHSINSVKGYSPEKFEQVSNATWDVYGIHFDCVKLRNYIYRSANIQRKGLGKFKGVLRWKYYTQYVDRIITKHQKVLISLLNNNPQATQDCKDLCDALSEASVLAAQELDKTNSLAYKVCKNTSNIGRLFKWKVTANMEKSEVHLLYFGNSLVKVEYEVRIREDGTYNFIVGGKPKLANAHYFNNVTSSNYIRSLSELYSFMAHLERHYLCPGVMIDGYEDQVQNIGDAPIYRTVAGEPAAFVEPLPSNLQVKVIRSTKYSLIVETDERCAACMLSSKSLYAYS